MCSYSSTKTVPVYKNNIGHSEAIRMFAAIVDVEKSSPSLLPHKACFEDNILMPIPKKYCLNLNQLKNRILIEENTSNTFEGNPISFTIESIRIIQQSFFEKTAVHVKYQDINNVITERTIEVHYLYLIWPIWYLLAWDHLRCEVRFFQLDRIQNGQLKSTPFSLKSLEVFQKDSGN